MEWCLPSAKPTELPLFRVLIYVCLHHLLVIAFKKLYEDHSLVKNLKSSKCLNLAIWTALSRSAICKQASSWDPLCMLAPFWSIVSSPHNHYAYIVQSHPLENWSMEPPDDCPCLMPPLSSTKLGIVGGYFSISSAALQSVVQSLRAYACNFTSCACRGYWV